MESALRTEAIGAIVGTCFEVELTFFEQGGVEQIGEAGVKESLEILGVEQRSQDGIVGELGDELVDARLQGAGVWARAHMGIEKRGRKDPVGSGFLSPQFCFWGC